MNERYKMKLDECLTCKKPMPDYKPEYCCPGISNDCACRGMPIDPPICSDECWHKLLNNHNTKVLKEKL